MKLSTTLIALLAAAIAAVAPAQALNYAQATAEVRAGVLLIDTQRDIFGPTNRTPHIWGNLDADRTVKPAKWSFVNPIGQTEMTQSMVNRWAGRPGGAPAFGSRLNKRSASYWEVPLSSSKSTTLNRFDVLSLTINGVLSLNSIEREKLRAYIDQGGILWIDLLNEAALAIDRANPTPFSFDWLTSNLPADANLGHPLLKYPNSLSLADVAATGYPVANPAVSVPVTVASLGGLDPALSWIVPDSLRLESVAGNTAGSTMSIGRIGQGFFVLTTQGVTATLNRGLDPALPGLIQPNIGFTGLTGIKDQPFFAAAKFAVNIASLGSQSLSSGVGSRRSGSTTTDLTAPLLRRFSDPLGAYTGSLPPAMYKGRVISTTGGQIRVYDARPDRDLDNNGDSDDGLTNPVGATFDLIWQSATVAGALSSPTVCEVPDSQLQNPDRFNLQVVEQVWATGSDGRMFCFDLSVDPASANLGNVAPVAVVTPPDAAAAAAGTPLAPTFHEGLLFVADTRSADGQGRIWIVNAALGQRLTSANDWKLFGSNRLPSPTAAPTVGYIPIQDGSGGLDKVAYLPTAPDSVLTPRPAGMTSIWIGARGESPIRRQLNGPNEILLTTRASFNQIPLYISAGPSTLGIKITMLKPGTADPFTQVEMAQYIGAPITQSSNGELRVPIVGNPGGYDLDGSAGNPNNTVGWRIDYHLDWGLAGTGFGQPSPDSFLRGSIEFPDDSALTRRVIGQVALGPEGNVYVVTSAGFNTIGGSFFNLREDKGRGDFTLVSRFDVYDALSFQLNGSSQAQDTVNMPSAFRDEDELVRRINFLDQPLQRMRFVGGPVVRGDTVYVLAASRKQLPFGPGAFSPTGLLLAFKANPGPATFEVEGQNQSFTLVQPDVALSTNKTVPEQASQLQQSQFVVEPIPGTTRSRIVFNSLMNVTRGRIRDTINASLPIIVRRGGQTDAVVEPEALADNGRIISGNARGSFNPLRWFVAFNGFDPETAPTVAGQTVYIGGASFLPSIIQGQFPPTENGLVFGMDATIEPNDEFLRSNVTRPWMLQLYTFLQNGPGIFDVKAANAIRWPQFRGIQSFDDLRIRILQAAVEEPRVRNLAAGDSTLAITGDSTLYGFSRADFFVCDSGRIARFDGAGNPFWATDQTLQAGEQGPVGAAGTTRQLSEPNRLYADGDNGYWVVDTGGNRIVRIDAAGRELRTIESFRIDPNFRPGGGPDSGAAQGTSAAEALALKRPRDVLVYTSEIDSTVPGANPFSNPQPLELWVHYVVADSGNFRAVELVDRYRIDPNTRRVVGIVNYADPRPNDPARVSPALGVLFWHSPEELSGKRYSYNSIARATVDIAGNRRTVVALGFGNLEPGKSTFGLDTTGQQVDANSGNGGIVLYDGANTVLVTEFQRPLIPTGSFLGETLPGSGLYDFNLPTLDQPVRTQKLVGMRSVTLRYVDVAGTLRLGVMITDNTGVYELVEDPANLGTWVVRWMLPLEAYVGMRRPRQAPPFNLVQLRNNPTSFRPMFARRLDSGDVLVVNGFVGRRFDGAQFSGEVVMVDGRFGGVNNDPGYLIGRPNLGFNALSIKFELPPVQGVRGLVAPVFAERQ